MRISTRMVNVFFIPKTAFGRVVLSDLALCSLRFLVKHSLIIGIDRKTSNHVRLALGSIFYDNTIHTTIVTAQVFRLKTEGSEVFV